MQKRNKYCGEKSTGISQENAVRYKEETGSGGGGNQKIALIRGNGKLGEKKERWKTGTK
jgi:hypothetical protein